MCRRRDEPGFDGRRECTQSILQKRTSVIRFQSLPKDPQRVAGPRMPSLQTLPRPSLVRKEKAGTSYGRGGRVVAPCHGLCCMMANLPDCDLRDQVDPEDRERDKPLCLRAKADLPSFGAGTPEVERRILLAALMEARGDGRKISYSRNKNRYADMKRYRGKFYTYAVPSSLMSPFKSPLSLRRIFSAFP